MGKAQGLGTQRVPKMGFFSYKGREEKKDPKDWGILEPQNGTHSSRKMKYSLRVTNTSTSCRMLGCFTLVAVGGVSSGRSQQSELGVALRELWFLH